MTQSRQKMKGIILVCVAALAAGAIAGTYLYRTQNKAPGRGSL